MTTASWTDLRFQSDLPAEPPVPLLVVFSTGFSLRCRTLRLLFLRCCKRQVGGSRFRRLVVKCLGMVVVSNRRCRRGLLERHARDPLPRYRHPRLPTCHRRLLLVAVIGGGNLRGS